MVDSSIDLDENDEEIIKMLQGKRAIVILNKTDLEMVVTKKQLKEKTDHPIISVSAKEQTGMEKSGENIKKDVFSRRPIF